MATYKVLQDIEAEDKLLGPLTARQCIYAAIAVVSCYLSYVVIANKMSFLVVFLLPFIGFGFFFAFPWTKQQSTEVWALARVRFALKPRRRIWDQNGTKSLVTVTAPVQTDPRRNNMSEREVVNRLQALANTIDSRGWAVKNVPVNLYSANTALSASDRLIAGGTLGSATPGPGNYDSTDIFDVAANPLAGELEAKMAAAASTKHQQLVTAVDTPGAMSPPANNEQTWYTPQAAASAAAQPTNNSTAGDEAMIAQSLGQPSQPQPMQAPIGAAVPAVAPANTPAVLTPQPTMAPIAPTGFADTPIRTPQPPVGVVNPANTAAPTVGLGTPIASPNPPPAPVTPPVNPAILELANNNDLNIATIAREAQQISTTHPNGTLDDGEVSVSLR